jgi:SAM-dependent methyltransferase
VNAFRTGQRGYGPGVIAPDGSAVELYRLLKPSGEDEIIGKAVPAGGTVLELGCGVGRCTAQLRAAGFDVTAVDESADMLAHVDGETVLGRIEDLRLDREFDGVLLGSHLVNCIDAGLRDALLATCRAHVRPGGAVIIQRSDPEFFAKPVVQQGRGVRFEVKDVQTVADGVLTCTLLYQIDGREWRQDISVRQFGDDLVDDVLAAAGLTFDSFLDDHATWLLARPRPA